MHICFLTLFGWFYLFVAVVRRFDKFIQRFHGNVCGSVAIPHISALLYT